MTEVQIDPDKIPQEMRDALVAAGWTPPPRVWLSGEEVPANVPVIDNYGEVHDDEDDMPYTANYDVVEMNIDWKRAVERAREART